MARRCSGAGWRRDTLHRLQQRSSGAPSPIRPTQRGLHRKHVFEACHDALRRLQVDYLDLYFRHRPDPNVPMEEIVRTMTDLVHQGKVLYWGTSGGRRRRSWRPMVLPENTDSSADDGAAEANMFRRDRVEVELAPLRKMAWATIWSPLAMAC